MSDAKDAYARFSDFLLSRQAEAEDDLDIREHMLGLVGQDINVGYVERTLAKSYGANLGRLFGRLHPVDGKPVSGVRHALMLGTVYPEIEKSHKGAVRLLNSLDGTEELILFEQGFLASSHSWSHAFEENDRTAACLGYVYDDIAHYFMADYPNRLIMRLNSDHSLTPQQVERARGLIDRIVAQKVTKYNAQPFGLPTMTSGYARRVLVCDQTYADASTFYGRLNDERFEDMLLAAIEENPDAEILVKSHPDTAWEPSKRSGYYSHLESRGRIRILRDPVNPYSLFEVVDTVYVGSSQIGLEALFAGKRVVCFGAPFYAGWGLTDDRHVVPHRRRQRSLEELFFIFYVWYTIYHVPGCPVPSSIEDALDYLERHRPYSLPPRPEEMSTTPRVSVVIPVHNMEAYVEECIRSVMGQTLREIEILPVNDLSTDGSQAIIDRLRDEDPRIRPIAMKKNVRQGFARNAALDVARGDYVWLLDADDFFADPTVLERVVRTADRTRADMVRTRKAFERVEDGDGTHQFDQEDTSERFFQQHDEVMTLAENETLLQTRHCWTWLYRRAFLDEHDIRFVLTQWEERPFLLAALLNASRITQTTIRGVAYRIRQGSTARRKKDAADVARSLENSFEVARLLKSHGAFATESPLRRHLTFLFTQSLQFVFFSWPYRVLAAKGDPKAIAELIDRFATIFEDAGFDVEDLDRRPHQLSRDHVGSGAVELLIAGIRNRDAALVERAVRRTPIQQTELFQIYRSKPTTPEERRREVALNGFARNKLVTPRRRFGPAKGPMPRVVLHIGATKTGSTFLQNLFERNRPALLRQGIWYPETGLFWQRPRPHKQAGHSEFTDAARRSDPALRGYLEAGLREMDGQVRTIVLSSEAFFLQSESHRICEYLRDYPIEVIVYLRRQDDWANSQYCEFVGGGAIGRISASPSDWLASERTRTLLDYRNTLRRFETVLPRSSIKVRPYNPSAWPDGDLLSDFAETAGLPEILELPRNSGRAANEARLSTGHIRILRHFNTLPFPSRDDYLRFIEEVTESIGDWRASRDLAIPKAQLLSASQRRAIVEDCRASNEEIAREWLGHDDGRLFDESVEETPVDDTIHGEEIDIIQAAYDRWSPPPPKEDPLSGVVFTTAPSRHLAEQFRIVNYGAFGWRRWGLTPFVRPHVRRRGSDEDLKRFNEDPATFFHSLKSPEFRGLADRLYPDRSVLGPGDVLGTFVTPLAWIAERLGGQTYANGLRRNPVLFFRLLQNPIYRGVGRVLFPIGEVRRADPQQLPRETDRRSDV